MPTPNPYPNSFPNARETELLKLILCDDADFPARFERWSQETDIDDIGEASMRLLPLVYLRMSKLGVRGPEFARIQGVYRLAWVQNQRLLTALDRAAGVFAAHGIRLLVLKGVPLLAQAYKNPGARFLSDADVLISRHDIMKAVAAMREAGWKISTPVFPDLSFFSQESIGRLAKEVSFRDENGLEIDLHWRLFLFNAAGDAEDDARFERWWTESVPFDFKGREYRSLSPEDMLLHVVAHGAPHNSHRPLRWVADAAAIARAFPVDWARLVRLAEASHLTTELRTGLAYMLEHGFVQMPEEARAAMLALTPPPAQQRGYAARANASAGSLFEPLRLLWCTYWRYDATGSFLGKVCRFPTYAQHARGLPSKRALFAYGWNGCLFIVRRIPTAFRKRHV